jgi:uncharacterized repeat protein (TIGR04138 family)
MSLRNDLAAILARDPRYTIQAYLFIFEALEFTKSRKKKKPGQRGRSGARSVSPPEPRHVTGRELCEGARALALEHYGMMALTVLSLWGINSTSDLGEIVYNLIAAGDLEKTPADSRTDFDDVYEFEEAFRRNFVLPLDEVA